MFNHENSSGAVVEYLMPIDVAGWLHDEFRFTKAIVGVTHKLELPRLRGNPLVSGWGQLGDRVLLNMPRYDAVTVRAYLEKCLVEARNGVTSVAMGPTKPEIRWWTDLAVMASDIRIIRGKVPFEGEESASRSTATCLFVFEAGDIPKKPASDRISYWSRYGDRLL